MQYANARDDGRWACMASRRGVYGFAYSCLQAIITELHGDRIAQAAMDCINYGGNFSWLEDVEIAVSEALEAYPV